MAIVFLPRCPSKARRENLFLEEQWWIQHYIIYLAPLSALGSYGSSSGAVIKLHTYCRWFIGPGVTVLQPRAQIRLLQSDCMYTHWGQHKWRASVFVSFLTSRQLEPLVIDLFWDLLKLLLHDITLILSTVYNHRHVCCRGGRDDLTLGENHANSMLGEQQQQDEITGVVGTGVLDKIN